MGCVEAKLNHEQKLIVYRLHAEGLTDRDIKAEIQNRYEVDMTAKGIYKSRTTQKAKPYIDHFKKQYLADIKKVPIANKRIRMNDKELIRSKCVEMIEKNKLKTKGDKLEFLQVAGRLNQISMEAREEMEKKPHMFGELMGAMREFSDDDLEKRKRELILRLRTASEGTNEDVGRGFDDSSTDSRGVEPENN